MNELEVLRSRNLSMRENIEKLEHQMLQLPQAECPVIHHFGPGIYIREVHIPAGIIAVGHRHKQEHLNIMLTGVLHLVGDDGQLKRLEAPAMFVAPPGRKVAYIEKDVVFQNIYATNERDIDKLEEMFLDKSISYDEHKARMDEFEYASRVVDRADFQAMLVEQGLTSDQVQAISECEDDLVPMPVGYENVTIRKSNIHGKGVFLSKGVSTGELIGPGRIGNMRTPIGRYTNHAKTPNARFLKVSNGDIYLAALRPIRGCCGGDQGEEVTVDYRQALAVNKFQLGECK